MESRLPHELDIEKTGWQRARERSVSSLRAYVLNNLAGDNLIFWFLANAIPTAIGGISSPSSGTWRPICATKVLEFGPGQVT